MLKNGQHCIGNVIKKAPPHIEWGLKFLALGRFKSMAERGTTTKYTKHTIWGGDTPHHCLPFPHNTLDCCIHLQSYAFPPAPVNISGGGGKGSSRSIMVWLMQKTHQPAPAPTGSQSDRCWSTYWRHRPAPMPQSGQLADCSELHRDDHQSNTPSHYSGLVVNGVPLTMANVQHIRTAIPHFV